MHLPVFFRLQINKIKCRSLKEILSEVGKNLKRPYLNDFHMSKRLLVIAFRTILLSFEQFSHVSLAMN